MTMYGAVGHSSRQRNLVVPEGRNGYCRLSDSTGIIESRYRNSGFALPVSADRIPPCPRTDHGLRHDCDRRSPLARHCINPPAVYADYIRYHEMDMGGLCLDGHDRSEEHTSEL